MLVCDRCLKAIESREGLQCRIAIQVIAEDEFLSRCEWCGESGFDILYSLIGSTNNNENEEE